MVSTPAISEAMKEILLDRFMKEIVRPFRTTILSDENGKVEKISSSFVMVNGQLKKAPKSAAGRKTFQAKNHTSIWSTRLRMGTNQCLRILEHCMGNHNNNHNNNSSSSSHEKDSHPSRPLLILLAKDVYPPTMLVHVPVMASKLGIPLLLLPGKASNELGRAVGVRKTSILLFLPSKTGTEGDGTDDEKIDSFIQYACSNMLNPNEPTDIYKSIN